MTPHGIVIDIDEILAHAEQRFAQGDHAAHLCCLLDIGPAVEGTQDPWRQATWHYWVGFLQCCAGDPPARAIEHCQTALDIAMHSGYDEIVPFAECCLAQALLMTGDLADGMAMGERALAVFEARGNLWWACRTLWHLSTLANAQRDYARSLAYCGISLCHGEALHDARLQTVACSRIGSTMILWGAIAHGLAWCTKARVLAVLPFDLHMIEAVEGHGHAKQGDLSRGVCQLATSLEWFKTASLTYTWCVFALHLAEVYVRQEHFALARRLWAQIRTHCDMMGYLHLAGRARDAILSHERLFYADH